MMCTTFIKVPRGYMTTNDLQRIILFRLLRANMVMEQASFLLDQDLKMHSRYTPYVLMIQITRQKFMQHT
jgi:hypothetical protein